MYAITGARRGEVLGLTWGAIDLEAATLWVERQLERQLVRLSGGPVFLPPKTVAAIRSLRQDSVTVAMLRTHKASQDAERVAWADAYQDGGLVFCKEDGSPLDPTGISRRFQVRRKAAKLPPSTLHGLRHAAATSLALSIGAHPETTRGRTAGTRLGVDHRGLLHT